LSRVINPDSAGKTRNRLTRSIILAIRHLMQQPEPNQEARDLAAFIALALLEIHDTVDVSVQAWEKRGYWVKADRFRMDWEWTGQVGRQLRYALLQENWSEIPALAAKIVQHWGNITIPERHRLGTPWVGAWKTLKESA